MSADSSSSANRKRISDTALISSQTHLGVPDSRSIRMYRKSMSTASAPMSCSRPFSVRVMETLKM